MTQYVRELAEQLEDATQIFIFGPGVMKTHLAKHLESLPSFGGEVKAVQAEQHLTQNQLVAAVRQFFQPRRAAQF